MRILFISLLLLTLVGCAHSNSAWHWPALYYYDSKALAEQNRIQYLADQNSQQYQTDQNSQYQNYPHIYPYTYIILDW
jgi:hypothetical protein